MGNIICELTKEPEPESTPNENTAVNTSSTAAEAAAKQRAQSSTAEERKRRNEEIDARANQARLERIEREKREAVDKERHRRKEGQKMQEVAKDMDDLEIKKMRQRVEDEKRADQDARRKVKEQIAKDKEARKKMFAPQSTSNSNTAAANTPKASTSITPAAADQCRIQIRCPDGSRLQNVFKSDEPLSAVRCFVEEQKNIVDRNAYQYSLTYPRKVFDWEDFDKPIHQHKLGSSTVIMLEKAS